jgi:hypothetical protein
MLSLSIAVLVVTFMSNVRVMAVIMTEDFLPRTKCGFALG